MKTPITIAGLALVTLFAFGCAKLPETQSSSASSPPAETGHPLRGVVVEVNNNERTVLVQHEEIPGVMPAMTMAFRVNATDLLGAHKDDRITGRMVQVGDDYWLRNIREVEPEPAETTAAATAPAPEPAPTSTPVAAAPAVADEPYDPAKGRAVYSRICITCHQANGQGMAPLFPPLVGADFAVDPDPTRAILAVLHGLTGPIEIKGRRFSGTMPGQGGMLNDADLAAALSYARSSWGNDAPPVSASQVAALRARYSERKAMWTAADLEHIEP